MGTVAFRSGHADVGDERRLSRWRLRLARLKLFNPFSGGFWVLPARPISRWVKVRAGALHYLELSAYSDDRSIRRGAVQLELHFYSILGREVLQRELRDSCGYNHQTAYFFADEQENTDQRSQRAYFCAPKGAVFALVIIRRSSLKQRVYIQTNFRLRRQHVDVEKSLAETLSGRDEFQLRLHLSKAEANADRSIAHALLARLVYLFERPVDRALQRKIAILDAVLAADGSTTKGKAAYNYDVAFNAPVEAPSGFEAWLNCEASSLRQLGVSAVEIGSGDDIGMRLLASRHAGLSVLLSSDLTATDQIKVGWLSRDDIKVLAQTD